LAAASQQQQKPLPPKAAPPEPDVLTTAALNDPDKGNQAVAELAEVVGRPDLTTATGQLPPKPLIMRAMAMLDTKMKQSQTALTALEQDLEKQLEEEEQERKAQEEEERKAAEAEHLKQKALLEKEQEEERVRQVEELEKERVSLEEGLKRSIEKQEGDFEKSVEAMKGSLEERVSNAQDLKRKEVDWTEELQEVENTFHHGLAKAQRHVDKALREAALADAKVTETTEKYKKRYDGRGGGDTESVIANVYKENRDKAKQADDEVKDQLLPLGKQAVSTGKDPKYGKTNEEWLARTRQVTGMSTAIYTQPSEQPYYSVIEERGKTMKPVVVEYVRDKRRKLKHRWSELAEEYIVRQEIYDKQHSKKSTSKQQKTSGTKSRTQRASILGMDGPSSSSTRSSEEPSAPGGTTGGRSSNPYRRPRRGQGAVSVGDVVRSEYEQDLIIAEITAKEAMEKRIAHGGSKLPRQVCDVERELSVRYVNTFSHQKVDDPMQEAYAQSITNTWTDMEKVVFLDRFLQYPKDFRKISTFLRNKTTKDCVAFYYNSKQSVPYKAALKEHLMRRKRRGEYHQWDATIDAALSVGAVITAGETEEKPLVFSLPPDDNSYHTFKLHPMKREVYDALKPVGEEYDKELVEEEMASRKKRRRQQEPLFLLEAIQRKFLKQTAQETIAKPKPDEKEASRTPTPNPVLPDLTTKRSSKWTAEEKRVFHETFEKSGKNWETLAAAVGTKTEKQIKNFYYDQKKHTRQKTAPREESKPKVEEPAPSVAEAPKSAKAQPAEVVNNDLYAIVERQLGAPRQDQTNQALLEAARAKIAQEQEQQAKLTLQRQLEEQAAQEQLRQTFAQQLLLNRQQQQQQQQQQQMAQLNAQEELRRLLQTQSQSQNPFSNLAGILPWVSVPQASQQHQQQNDARNFLDAATNIQAATNLQNLLALRGFGSDGASLRSMAQLANLSSLNQNNITAETLRQLQRSQGTPPSMETADSIMGYGGNTGFGLGAPSGAPAASPAATLEALGLLARGAGASGAPGDYGDPTRGVDGSQRQY